LMGKVIATIEARMTSSRLPGKVLMEAGGKPMLQILVERLQNASTLDGVVVATTVRASDDPIESLCLRLGVGCFRGSEENVLERVCGAAVASGAETLVEITGDCPLVDPWQVDHAVDFFRSVHPGSRYVSNCAPAGNAPVGMNVQVFRAADLFDVLAGNTDDLDREHVSYHFYRKESGDRYRPCYIKYDPPLDRPDIWVTLDYQEDYELLMALYEQLAPTNAMFGLGDVIAWIDRNPEPHRRCKVLRNL
jgi:spore coat polysaccharide biosynthesis protein SpsF